MSALMPVPASVPRMRGARAGLRAVLRLWERLSMYLPLLMMALLALGTYWLVRTRRWRRPPSRHGRSRMRWTISCAASL